MNATPSLSAPLPSASIPNEARVANCPQCGGVTRKVAGLDHLQCQYCESLVFDSDNPLSVDGIKPLGSELNSPCPCCNKPLSTGMAEEFPVLYCRDCRGVLMKNGHFGAALRERRARRAGAEAAEPRPIDPEQYERRLNCPACQRKMEVHPYYGPGNVVIDSCEQCSYVWLDHGELARLERASGSREVLTAKTYVDISDPDSVPANIRGGRDPWVLSVLGDLFL